MNEYCDQGECPAQAQVQILTACGPLYFCRHHFGCHRAAIERSAFDVLDFQTGLSAPSAGSARKDAGRRHAENGRSCTAF